MGATGFEPVTYGTQCEVTLTYAIGKMYREGTSGNGSLSDVYAPYATHDVFQRTKSNISNYYLDVNNELLLFWILPNH